MLIETLPADDFGVELQNDGDCACLLWLVNRIGETKLRSSVAKYQERWPASRPFVWTLLRWYRLKVPRAVYAPVSAPVYWLYVLCRRDGSEVKIGQTGNWPSRAYAFALPYRALDDVFDLDLSRAYLVGGNKEEVLRREREVKKQFAHCRVDARSREWFDGAATTGVLEAAASFDEGKLAVWQTLGEALEIKRKFDLQNPSSLTNDKNVEANNRH